MPFMRLRDTFTLNTTPGGDQIDPKVIHLTDGRIVSAWWSTDAGDGSGSCIRARIVSPEIAIYGSGNYEASTDFIVNTTTAEGQYYPSLVALSSGGFAVSWYSYSGPNRLTLMQIFDANGAKQGPELLAEVGVGGRSSIAQLDTGEIVVSGPNNTTAYTDSGQFLWSKGFSGELQALDDGKLLIVNRLGTSAIIVNHEGDFVGSPLTVNTSGTSFSYSVALLASGNFVITWSDSAIDGSGYGISAKIFDQSGSELRSEFQINDVSSGDQYGSVVKMLPGGGFAVAWVSAEAGGSVKFQVFDDNGQPTAPAFTANTASVSATTQIGLDVTADSRLIVSWQSNHTGDPGGIDDAIRTGVFDLKTFIGTGGADVWQGNAASETAYGSNGNDIFHAREGNDYLNGGAGRDLLDGGFGNDILEGGSDNDTMFGGAGNDVISGGTGNDLLNGNEDADTLSGGNGDDTLLGGDQASHVDVMFGGAGNDIYLWDGIDLVGEAIGDGVDTIYSIVSNYALDIALENVALYAGFSGAVTATGNANANALYGNEFANILSGLGGNDTLAGGTGGDYFLFETNPGADVILDFFAPEDQFILRGAAFGLTAGVALQTGLNFISSAAPAAVAAKATILHSTSNGGVYWDADGTGAAFAPILFAGIGGASVSALDFMII